MLDIRPSSRRRSASGAERSASPRGGLVNADAEDTNRRLIVSALLQQKSTLMGPRRATQWFPVYHRQGLVTEGTCVKTPQRLIRWEPILWAIANKYEHMTRVLLAGAEKTGDLDRPSSNPKDVWGRKRQLQCLKEAAELIVPKPPAKVLRVIDSFAAK